MYSNKRQSQNPDKPHWAFSSFHSRVCRHDESGLLFADGQIEDLRSASRRKCSAGAAMNTLYERYAENSVFNCKNFRSADRAKHAGDFAMGWCA